MKYITRFHDDPSMEHPSIIKHLEVVELAPTLIMEGEFGLDVSYRLRRWFQPDRMNSGQVATADYVMEGIV